MEFPPEIIDLIRQYSLPCFKYFREYNRMVMYNGEWPALRSMLETNPTMVLDALDSFDRAAQAFIDSKRAFKWRKTMEWEVYKARERDFYQKRLTLMKKERILHSIIEDPAYPRERKVEYRI
jgi:hypothetical protein